MKTRLLLAVAAALLICAAPASARHATGATVEDLRGLQTDLELLDDTLADLPASHPRAREFRERADEIRDEVTYLKVQIRRHQRNRRAGLGASKAEVQNIQTMIDSLQADLDAALERRLTGEATLSEGTEIVVRLEQPLSSETARREDRFDATVADSVMLDGRAVIPVGTRVRGIVTRVEKAERPVRGGKMDLTFDSIWLDDRTRVDLRTQVVSIRPGIDKSETAERAGIGAVLGGLLGTLIGGKKGALIGAILGVGGGIGATQGEDVFLPTGTLLTLKLERPLVVRR